MIKPDISIVIPVGNDPKIISCLDALTACRGSVDFETIVVDSFCSESLLHALTAYQKMFPLKIISVPTHNIGLLRNRGIQVSEGKIIYFLDSDCIVSPSTLKAALRCGKKFTIARGKIQFVGNSYFSSLDARMRAKRYDSDPTFAYCPNLVVKKELFKSVGPFDETYHYGSDGEFAHRIRTRKIPVRYEPSMILVHQPLFSLYEIVQKWIHYGEGRYKRMKDESLLVRARSLFTPNLFNANEGLAYNLMCFGCMFFRWVGWTRQAAREYITPKNAPSGLNGLE